MILAQQRRFKNLYSAPGKAGWHTPSHSIEQEPVAEDAWAGFLLGYVNWFFVIVEILLVSFESEIIIIQT